MSIIGMGKGIATAILHVAHPDQYGVWNNVSENALTELGLMPGFDRGSSFGERYVKVNAVLHKVKQELGLDLWALDLLWWRIGHHEAVNNDEPPSVKLLNEVSPSDSFALERHLQDYLDANWDRISQLRGWKIFSRPGEPRAGYGFNIPPVGQIDLLARHRTKPKWLVIELKKQSSSDKTIGQILRYMGWVSKHLAKAEESVEGLIIAHSADLKLLYAASAVPTVSFMSYKINFQLTEVAEIDDSAET